MGTWPLVVREFRVLARQGQLYWLRVIGGVAGFATLSFLLLQPIVVGAQLGDRIFTALNVMLFVTILLVGPVVTSDCIAQEKREGTLGLLFLAPISEREIVLSKLAINAVRAMTLLLSVLPMIALPVVFGGIGAQKLTWALLLQVTALCVALSAGILASTLHRSFIQTAVAGEFYAVGMAIVCLFFISISPLVACVVGVMLTLIVVEFCSTNLKDIWELESSDYKEPFWVRIFSESQTGRALFRWDTRRARSFNPIAWLQEYSWSARLAKWGWFALIVILQLYILAKSMDLRGPATVENIAGPIALIVGMALTGANSFRRERVSGAMELLLVTPLSPMQIIFGRLWGIWVHFFPAALVIVLLWLSAARFLSVNPVAAYIFLSCYVFLPLVGLYVSLFPWNILVAWVVIFLVGAALPVYAGQLFYESPENGGATFVIVLQAIAGTLSFGLLHNKLKKRAFRFL